MYKQMVSPILDRLGSERMHIAARETLHYLEIIPGGLRVIEWFADQHQRFTDERLRVTVGNLEFENPLLVGAGWDKDGRAVKGLWQLGFAAVEVGAVLAHAQDGNPKPRQFMVAPGVAINWLGFNSPGMEVVYDNVRKYKRSGIQIGFNIGMNRNVPFGLAPEAHAMVITRLHEPAAYFTINVASPNTPGLRALQDKKPLTDIVQACKEAIPHTSHKPLFVKIAPDLSFGALDDVIDVCISEKLAGIVASNTTNSIDIKKRYGDQWPTDKGGISGDDETYRQMVNAQIRHIYRSTKGALTIIGVGGIKDTATALEKITSGATLIQVVTAIRGKGPTLPGEITRGLAAYLDRENIKHISELIGIKAV